MVDGHAHPHGHHDHNLRSAYFHVLTDALTSVFAIVALLSGRFYGWRWMDPVMGTVIAHWSWGLLRGAGAVLRDTTPDRQLTGRIRRELEEGNDRVTDLNLWRIGPGHLAMIASLVSDQPQDPDHYKAKLAGWPQLAHVTIEVQSCSHASRAA